MKATIRVLNVGHGDCHSVVIESGKTTHSMLIDAGGADAGVDIVDHLFEHGGLPDEAENRRIDLLIATHRDEDHLEGLVKVVESGKFDIRCVWAPIILTPTFDPLFRSRTLAQFSTFTEAAMRYPDGALDAALDDMESALTRRLHDGIKARITEKERVLDHVMPLMRNRSAALPENDGRYDIPGLDNRPLLAGLVSLGTQIERNTDVATLADLRLRSYRGRLDDDLGEANAFPEHFLGSRSGPLDYVALLSRATVRAVSWVTRGTRFIQACKKASIPLHMPMVADRQVSKGRLPGAPSFDGVEMRLLSPTEGLVAEYASDLALPEGAELLMRALRPVTPANKPSYVFTLKVGDAVALFTGDSGFTDFVESPGSKDHGYREDRIKLAAEASWVKVPHHAGSFEYFDRCFEHAAELGILKTGIFVSCLGPDGKKHATPNKDFETFAQNLRNTVKPKPQFHFTNRPMRDRFDEVCPNCNQSGDGVGPPCLEYASGNGNKWNLKNKAALICCRNTLSK